ncbi:Putative auto-transporter adhesin, head GIN domain [Halpernia humi]|uniref:Putative auto-transporter adhesin, head GIN domain n=1 Tax=Halpernia humi TaxID=493375 RepID=A0A1H5SUF9_9FLAO|nr:head GIN domain-containing protein [Halpernia humi]SEF54130.1 Putative auto-transporter adhesin, head GIN domain [Halpernia humi]
MKTTLILLSTSLLLTCSCSIKINDKDADISDLFSKSKTISGTGEIQNKTFNLDFDGIKVSSGIHAEVLKSDVEKVVVSAPSDLLNEVLVEKNGNQINIHFKPNLNIRNASSVKATIYAKDFSKLIASSSGNIIVKDKFTQDKVEVAASSSGNIKGDLEANDFTLQVSSSGNFSGKIWAVNFNGDVSSSGDATVTGSATNSTIEVSSSGNFYGKDFSTKTADLATSSSGDIYIKVSDKLNASTSSSGDIYVTKSGNLQVQSIKESSSGKVSVR